MGAVLSCSLSSRGTCSSAPASRLTSPRFCSVTSYARQWVCSSPVVGYALLPAVGYAPVGYALLTVVLVCSVGGAPLACRWR